MKDEERKKLRELRVLMRKALKNGTLTEKELFAFMRSRRLSKSKSKSEHHRPTIDELRNKKMKTVNYRLTTIGDVFEYPEPTFIVDQILIEGTVNVLGAYTGVGKSITALSLIKSVLTGEPLWGKYPVVKTGPVLLVDEETPKSFLRERIEKMGFDKSLRFYFLHFQNVRLDQDDYFNALLEKIKEVKAVLVVIDSLIRVHRQREDEATSMALIVDRLRKIANSGTTVLVIHHHRKGEGPLSQKLRGSSDIPGGVDIEYALIPKDDYLIFSSVKTRTKPLTPISLKLVISGTEIKLTYAGTEEEEVISTVIEILRDGRALGVKEIWEALRQREYEIGEKRLRAVLTDGHDGKISGKKVRAGRATKWVYRLGNSLGHFSSIIEEKNDQVNDEEEIHLAGEDEKKEDSDQVKTLDNQRKEVTWSSSKKPVCQVENEPLKPDNSLGGSPYLYREQVTSKPNLYEGEGDTTDTTSYESGVKNFQAQARQTIEEGHRLCPNQAREWASRNYLYGLSDMNKFERQLKKWDGGGTVEELQSIIDRYIEKAKEIVKRFHQGW